LARIRKAGRSRLPLRANPEQGRSGALVPDPAPYGALLKAVGLGGLGGATSAIKNKLSEKRWSDAARPTTKEAAKRGVKIAVKGGVVGLAATLGASAVSCATCWA
jgi:hypothetical protein